MDSRKLIKKFRKWLVSAIAPKIDIYHAQGEFGGPKSTRLSFRLEIADEMQNRMGADLYCKRCKLSYGLVVFHQTNLGNGRGCLAICEDCYQELLYPHHRLPYYMETAKERGWKESSSQLMSALENEHSRWLSQFDHVFIENKNGKPPTVSRFDDMVKANHPKSERIRQYENEYPSNLNCSAVEKAAIALEQRIAEKL